MIEDLFANAEADARRLLDALGMDTLDIFLVSGTGWQPAIDALGDQVATIDYSKLGGFVDTSVEGHRSELALYELSGRMVLVSAGRVHLYEGHTPSQIAHPIRTAVLAGCKTVILTNAAGGISDDFQVGSLVTISDHINLTGQSPMTGQSTPPRFGSRFVSLIGIYSKQLRQLAHDADGRLGEGVYAGVPGPHLETPAEVRMLQAIGADMVGMSTVIEAIAARHVGADVLGISLITNIACKDESSSSSKPFGMSDLIEVATDSAQRSSALLRHVIAGLSLQH